MIVPSLPIVPTGFGRVASPALPAVDAVRAVRPVAPEVERGVDKTGRRDRARAGLRTRVALGLEAVLGLPVSDPGADDRDGTARPGFDAFVETLETALLAVAESGVEPEPAADRLTQLVRLAYGHADDGFARLLERLGSDSIVRDIPALGPVLGELAARFAQLADAAPPAGGPAPTLARLLAAVAEPRGDLVSADA